MNIVFNRQFHCLKVIRKYGVHRKSIQVINYYNQSPIERKAAEGLHNPMCDLFPTVVSCDMKTVGASGQPETFNGLCVLSQNIINQWVRI